MVFPRWKGWKGKWDYSAELNITCWVCGIISGWLHLQDVSRSEAAAACASGLDTSVQFGPGCWPRTVALGVGEEDWRGPQPTAGEDREMWPLFEWDIWSERSVPSSPKPGVGGCDPGPVPQVSVCWGPVAPPPHPPAPVLPAPVLLKAKKVRWQSLWSLGKWKSSKSQLVSVVRAR